MRAQRFTLSCLHGVLSVGWRLDLCLTVPGAAVELQCALRQAALVVVERPLEVVDDQYKVS